MIKLMVMLHLYNHFVLSNKIDLICMLLLLRLLKDVLMGRCGCLIGLLCRFLGRR